MEIALAALGTECVVKSRGGTYAPWGDDASWAARGRTCESCVHTHRLTANRNDFHNTIATAHHAQMGEYDSTTTLRQTAHAQMGVLLRRCGSIVTVDMECLNPEFVRREQMQMSVSRD